MVGSALELTRANRRALQRRNDVRRDRVERVVFVVCGFAVGVECYNRTAVSSTAIRCTLLTAEF